MKIILCVSLLLCGIGALAQAPVVGADMTKVVTDTLTLIGKQAAQLLEVPTSRFFKPELARFLGF